MRLYQTYPRIMAMKSLISVVTCRISSQFRWHGAAVVAWSSQQWPSPKIVPRPTAVWPQQLANGLLVPNVPKPEAGIDVIGTQMKIVHFRAVEVLPLPSAINLPWLNPKPCHWCHGHGTKAGMAWPSDKFHHESTSAWNITTWWLSAKLGSSTLSTSLGLMKGLATPGASMIIGTYSRKHTWRCKNTDIIDIMHYCK